MAHVYRDMAAAIDLHDGARFHVACSSLQSNEGLEAFRSYLAAAVEEMDRNVNRSMAS